MKPPRRKVWLMLGWSLLVTGCGGPLLEVTVVDERTALENQVLGSYAELQREVMLLTSVRAIDPQGRLARQIPRTPEYRAVLRALQRQAFNRDDLDHFRKIGVIGENNQGGVTVREVEQLPAEARTLARRLVEEENQDRAAIWERLILAEEGLVEADLPRVRGIFAAMNRDQASPGAWIQLPDGGWRMKEGAGNEPERAPGP
ncbi:hypothetical protein SIID45300_03086 [Candidatus Magnetaquicoccaceae bacterium FCR-1]|uniref:DUF1318 domain-containing protein n=1 Tax=Candidatus Magnetaquiglobus chichijimensis TaxID=3141448 RepID=A0ABQ0CCW9_9PROT